MMKSMNLPRCGTKFVIPMDLDFNSVGNPRSTFRALAVLAMGMANCDCPNMSGLTSLK